MPALVPSVCRDKPSAEAYQQHLHELVLPRLMACLLAALSHGGLEPLELHMRLQDIMGADVVAGGMQEEAAGRLSLVMELLQRSSGMGALLAEQCAQTLLPWALRVACTACYGSMLRGSASALEGQLQHSCLSFLTGIAFAELQEAWRAALMQLFALGEWQHVALDGGSCTHMAAPTASSMLRLCTFCVACSAVRPPAGQPSGARPAGHAAGGRRGAAAG